MSVRNFVQEVTTALTSVEQRCTHVCEVTATHEVVSLDRTRDIFAMNADRDAHQHVLRSLDDTAVHTQKVR